MNNKPDSIDAFTEYDLKDMNMEIGEQTLIVDGVDLTYGVDDVLGPGGCGGYASSTPTNIIENPVVITHNNDIKESATPMNMTKMGKRMIIANTDPKCPRWKIPTDKKSLSELGTKLHQYLHSHEALKDFVLSENIKVSFSAYSEGIYIDADRIEPFYNLKMCDVMYTIFRVFLELDIITGEQSTLIHKDIDVIYFGGDNMSPGSNVYVLQYLRHPIALTLNNLLAISIKDIKVPERDKDGVPLGFITAEKVQEISWFAVRDHMVQKIMSKSIQISFTVNDNYGAIFRSDPQIIAYIPDDGFTKDNLIKELEEYAVKTTGIDEPEFGFKLVNLLDSCWGIIDNVLEISELSIDANFHYCASALIRGKNILYRFLSVRLSLVDPDATRDYFRVFPYKSFTNQEA